MTKIIRRGAIAAAVCAMIAGSAQASILNYGFTVSGGWFDSSGTPFGMALSPNLSGTVQVDNSLVGFSAITGFSFATGSKTWTLAEVGSGGTTFDGFGALTQFNVQFSDALGGGYVYSSNTAAIQEYATGEYNACNGCVSIGQGVAVTPVPEPETYAMLLAGLGLLGAAARRRRRLATA